MIMYQHNTIKQVLMLLIAVVIMSTSLMPREFFDPHMGIDTDIFCRTMSEYNSGILDTGCLCESQVHIVDIVLIIIKAFISTETLSPHSIRSPPSYLPLFIICW